MTEVPVQTPRHPAIRRRPARRPAGAVLALTTALAAWPGSPPASANPVGPVVTSGTASAVQSGPQLTIQASHNAVLDWKSFNIQPGETTTFVQPSAQSVVWNRILDQNPSQIWGTLNANGFVVLMNAAGFYFGPNSVVNVGGFLATTAPVITPGAGGPVWQFDGAPPSASIINYGQIQTARGGSLFLVAEKIENHGTLMAPDGTLGLYAGKEVLVSDSPDGRGLSAKVDLPAGAIDNTGKLIADAGSIALHAQVVNQDGLIQANSVRERNGVIELVASAAINLGAHSVLRANGSDDAPSNGGQITVKSAQQLTDDPASQISVRGGGAGGNGGSMEVSAARLAGVQAQLDGSAQPGWLGGSLLLDPDYLIISSAGSIPPGGTVDAGTPGGIVDPVTGETTMQVKTFSTFANITLQAQQDITLAASTFWNLNPVTGSAGPYTLRLEAGRNIIFGDNSRITAGKGWSVQMAAGADFSAPLSVPATATGSILMNNGTTGGAIQTQDGNIQLVAATDLLIGGVGYIRTTGGGSISIQTLNGNVDAGYKNEGYRFFPTGYQPNPAGIGGIGTAAGGNVTVNAGANILSHSPAANTLPAAIGAYGSGDVHLRAGNDITGFFLVRNGVGTIDSKLDVGNSGNPVTLSLVSGSWQVNGARDVYVSEVQNPNGTFNSYYLNAPNGQRLQFLFDYAPDAAVSIDGGNSVQLGSPTVNPVRTPNNVDLLPVYPPILNVSAGAGGVILGRDLVLYPSPLGALNLQTTGGGLFAAAAGQSFQLVMSDSADLQYNQFITAHSTPPMHLATAADPVVVDVSGNIENLRLQIPKQATIRAGGDTVNFFYTGQNLTPADTTSILVAGDIKNRATYTTIQLSEDPNLWVLQDLFDSRPDLNLGAQVRYDPTTRTLTFFNRMSLDQLAFLLAPQVYTYDWRGDLVLDANGLPKLSPAKFVVSDTDATQLSQLYKNTQDVPTFPVTSGGFLFAGPGNAKIAARNLDLGVTLGIRSVVAGLNPAVAVLNPALLTGTDVVDAPGLLNKLELGSDPVAQFLWSQFRSDFRQFLGGASVSPLSAQGILVSELNRLIAGPSIYDATRFAGVTLRPATAALLAQNPTGADRMRLQRMLLEDAFPAVFGLYGGGPVGVPADGVNLSLTLGYANGDRAAAPIPGAGNLTMVSSQIGSFNRGSIDLLAAGNLDVGSQFQFSSDASPKGIYTGHGGDVTVAALGDVRINGSRIGTYDGGNVTVISRDGVVDAGSGGKGFFSISTDQYNPATGQVESQIDQFFGSGIVALTRQDSAAVVGDITVKAGKDILANSGGILQLGFNQADARQSFVDLESGGNIEANASGILGVNVRLKAVGDVTGLVVANQNINIAADKNVSVTALGGGGVSVNAGGNVAGTIAGGAGVDVSGGAISAALVSSRGNVTTSGDSAGARVGAFNAVAAPVAVQTTTDNDKPAVAAKPEDTGDTDDKKKKKPIQLARSAGRVTVILPKTP